MSRIDLQIVGTANFTQIESAVNRLRAQLASINSMQMTGLISRNAQQSIDGYLQTFRDTIDASGMYQRQLVNITNETERFGRSLERGNLRLGQLYKTAMDYRRTEIGQIRQLAREQIRMQNAVAISRGDGMAEVFIPRGIDEGIEKTRILSQEYKILRQVVRNGSTELINWGKNTQWAGRQLTVGLTVPITMFGAAAAKAFMDADKQLTRLTKVYGDAAKGMVSNTELEQIRSQAIGLAQDIASGMGVSVTETLGIAADIAATGKEGNELLNATREAMRLSVLGEVDRQEAMRATLAVQTVFKQNTEGLAESINFLNAVENQTSATINDLVTGIVKAGPVVQGLGGEIKDLALMMVAMREGGVPASEAANAIKSSLGALINPTKQTTQVLNEFGIDLKGIVDRNAGDVIGTLTDLQSSLEGLDELSRQRSIEQIFGKFQFARINALLNNLNKAGSQTEQVMALAEMSASQLAQTAQKELEAVTESVSGRFIRAFESLKANLIPIGETFTEIGTILLNVGSKILEVFNALPDPVKNFFKLLTLGTAVIGPIIMITGVLGNFFGYLVKGISTLMLFKKAGRGAFELITPESAATMKATELLTESLFDQTTAVNVMAQAIERLVSKLELLQIAMADAANTPTVDSGALAAAEARAAGATGATTPYREPVIPFQRRRPGDESKGTAGGSEFTYGAKGVQGGEVEWSHLVALSDISEIAKKQGKELGSSMALGVGSWVTGIEAEIQKEFKDFTSDIAVYSESNMTPEFRREELKRIARSRGMVGAEYDQISSKIEAMSDEQLARILPSWEKIRKSGSEYMGVMKSIGDGMTKGNAAAKSEIAKAWSDFQRDSLTDPASAMTKLKETLSKVELDAEGTILDVEENIRNAAGSMDVVRERALLQQDPEERRRAMKQGMVEDVIIPFEVQAIQDMESLPKSEQLGGFGKKSGTQYVLAAAAEQLANDYMNQSSKSEELKQAYAEAIDSKRDLVNKQRAEEVASKQLSDADKELAAVKDAIATKLQSGTYRQDAFERTGTEEDPQWVSASSKKAVRDKELTDLLERRYQAEEAARLASENHAKAQADTIPSIERHQAASEKLALAKEQEAQRYSQDTSDEELQAAQERLAAATEKEAAARERAAQSTQDFEDYAKSMGDTSKSYSDDAKRAKELMQNGGKGTPEFEVIAERLRNNPEYVEDATRLAELNKQRERALKELTDAEKELADSTEEASMLQEKANATTKENTAATEKDTKETKESANSQNMQETANKQNVNATQIDTKETIEAAGSENLQEIANKKNAGATGGGFMSKFGGGGRLTGLGAGLGSALSMATMFMPTGDNEALNTATNILGGAGMGASMGAMAGPWGALAGGVIGAAIPAVTAFVDAQQKTNDALVAYGQSLAGASQVMEGFGSELGRRSPAERLTEALSGLKIPQEAQAAAQSILQGETGQAMLNSARGMAGPEREAMLLTQLKQLTLTEIFTPEEAKAVAAELGTELGDPSLGKNLVDGILSVLDTDGKLIRDAISGQFADTLPSVEEILSNAAVKKPVALSGGQISAGVYTMGIDEITGKMSLMAGTLKQVSEAEALVKLSFQNGEITRRQYVDQMADLNEKNLAVKQTLESLMNIGTVNLIGAESILGDIAAAQGVTEEFDKVVGKVMEISDLIDTTDVFAIPLQTAAAYGQLASGELQQFQDMLMADPELQTRVTAIFDQDGSEEYALEIIRMINSGVDAEKIQVILETRGVQEGVELIDTFNMTLATLPPETQADIISTINYDPSKMDKFITDYDYVNNLPDTNKELKALVFGNDELTEIQANWESFLSLPAEERKTAVMHSIYNIEYSYATTGALPTANEPENFESPLDAASMASAATSSTGGGSGGGSADTSGIDKQIEKQRELIESIQEEREERQKLLNLQKESSSFALKQQDLENQIARARAEGNFAQAALLEGQLNAAKAERAAEERERALQEKEDRRIKKAEKEIERLEDQKSTSSGGGGGAAGGISAEQQQRLQQQIQFINDELMAAIERTGVASWAQEIYENGATAFWDSEPVRNYIQAAKQAGVPIEAINTSLEQLFDNIVTQGWEGQQVFDGIKKDLLEVGVSGETAAQILPNVFAILNDPNLSKSEVIDGLIQQFVSAGDTVEEAERRARKFFNLDPSREALYKNIQGFKEEFGSIKDELDPEAGKIIMEEYLSGINKGLSETDILANIRKRLVDSLLPEFPEGMSETAKQQAINLANQQANLAIDTIEGRLTEYTPTPVKITVEPPPNNAYGTGPGGAPEPGTENGTSGGTTAINDFINNPPIDAAKNAGALVGTAIGEGVGVGLTTNPNLSSYWDTANSTLEEALNGYWQINSPSERAKPIGSAIMEGIVAGMAGTTALSLVPAMMQPLIDSVKATFSTGFMGVVDAYRVLFSDPTNGIVAVTDSVIKEASDNFYTTMTTRMQETVDEINNIMKKTLTGYTFDIVGVPKIYVTSGTQSVWERIIPNFGNFQTTPTLPIQRASGGYVSGPGGPTDDKIPAMLSDGEYVIRASSVSQYGTKLLDRINAGKFADGGLVRLNPNNMSIIGEKMAEWMTQYDGVPYNKGAAWADGPENGWGCATATRWLYDKFAGINIGHDSLSNSQYSSGVGKQVSDTLPGDQQFFYYANGVNVGNAINHTGVAQSGSTMYHASGGTHGSYTNAAIDIAARNLAASRAGGTAQKRYLPETIGGMGVPVGRLKNGGMIFGQGGPTEDNILAMVSNGEFVMNAFAVKKYGKDFMDAVNNGTLAEAAAGGLMSKYPGYVAKMSSGGSVMARYANGGLVDSGGSNIQYNINVNVEGSNSSADEIANAVMKTMERKERMNRGTIRI